MIFDWFLDLLVNQLLFVATQLVFFILILSEWEIWIKNFVAKVFLLSKNLSNNFSKF